MSSEILTLTLTSSNFVTSTHTVASLGFGFIRLFPRFSREYQQQTQKKQCQKMRRSTVMNRTTRHRKKHGDQSHTTGRPDLYTGSLARHVLEEIYMFLFYCSWWCVVGDSFVSML